MSSSPAPQPQPYSPEGFSSPSLAPKRPHLSPVEQSPATDTDSHTDVDTGEHIPDPTPLFVRALAARAFEAVEGTRSIAQLGTAITFGAARQLAEQRQAVAERRALSSDAGSCAPSPGPLHLSRLLPRLAEASVAMHTGRRTHAVSLRLEWSHGRWRASELFVL